LRLLTQLTARLAAILTSQAQVNENKRHTTQQRAKRLQQMTAWLRGYSQGQLPPQAGR